MPTDRRFAQSDSFALYAEIAIDAGKPWLGVVAAAIKLAMVDAQNGSASAQEWLDTTGRYWIWLLGREMPSDRLVRRKRAD